eukprot:750124-Hanusia_phi.AAC.2
MGEVGSRNGNRGGSPGSKMFEHFCRSKLLARSTFPFRQLHRRSLLLLTAPPCPPSTSFKFSYLLAIWQSVTQGPQGAAEQATKCMHVSLVWPV